MGELRKQNGIAEGQCAAQDARALAPMESLSHVLLLHGIRISLLQPSPERMISSTSSAFMTASPVASLMYTPPLGISPVQ